MKSRGIFRASFPSPGGRCAAARGDCGRGRHAGLRVRCSSDQSAYQELDRALAGMPHALHYALKANSTLAVAATAPRAWAAAPTRTPSERSKWPCAPGSTRRRSCSPASARRPTSSTGPIGLDIKTINAESPGELRRIATLARARGTTARVALRVNPDIDARSHPHISTGLRTNKFGVPIESARDLYREAAATPGLLPVGVHVHVGSQITSLEPLTSAAAAHRGARHTTCAPTASPSTTWISAAGSASPTTARASPRSATTPRRSSTASRRTGFTLVLEPGRALVGAAGVLLTRVVDVKEYPGGRGSRFSTRA